MFVFLGLANFTSDDFPHPFKAFNFKLSSIMSQGNSVFYKSWQSVTESPSLTFCFYDQVVLMTLHTIFYIFSTGYSHSCVKVIAFTISLFLKLGDKICL